MMTKKTQKDTAKATKNFRAALSFQLRTTKAQEMLLQSQPRENWKISRLRKEQVQRNEETHPEREETNPLHQILTKDHLQELH